jgi:hypothetical protein
MFVGEIDSKPGSEDTLHSIHNEYQVGSWSVFVHDLITLFGPTQFFVLPVGIVRTESVLTALGKPSFRIYTSIILLFFNLMFVFTSI